MTDFFDESGTNSPWLSWNNGHKTIFVVVENAHNGLKYSVSN